MFIATVIPYEWKNGMMHMIPSVPGVRPGNHEAPCFTFDHLGHRSEREAVDEQASAVREVGQHPGGGVECLGSWIRKTVVEHPNLDRPATPAQAFRHAPIILIAARGVIETSGDDKHD